MSNNFTRRDPWRWPVLLLWSMFFILGLWPELSFTLMRSAGYVFSQNAIINSYHFITWCLTGYIVHFAYHRCLEANLPAVEALGKAMQIGVLAFVAFIDMPVEQFFLIRDAMDRALVFGMAAVKVLTWLYLLSLLVRFHWHRKPEIIAHSLTWLALSSPAETKSDSATSTEDDTTEELRAHRAPIENRVD